MFLINNLLPKPTLCICFPWAWYIWVDFQLFLLVPLVVCLYKYRKSLGVAASILIIVGSLICDYVLAAAEHYHYILPTPGSSAQLNYLQHYYMKPYNRASPYFIGILLGFFYQEQQASDNVFTTIANKIRHSTLIRV
jgi:hypothetical protein